MDGPARRPSRLYFRFAFFPFAPFLALDLAAFLGDFFAGFAVVFFDDDDRPPPKMLSQLSEYCFVAPMRTTLMVAGGP